MGTHPIFESDFDCLTECRATLNLTSENISEQNKSSFGDWPVVTPIAFYVKGQQRVKHKNIKLDDLQLFWHDHLKNKIILKFKTTFDLQYWHFLFKGKSEILQINYGEIDKQTIISLARTIPVAAVFKISKKLYSYSTPFVNIRWGAKKESQVHPYEAQIPMATMRKCGTKTENKFYDFILSKESQELHRKIQKSR